MCGTSKPRQTSTYMYDISGLVHPQPLFFTTKKTPPTWLPGNLSVVKYPKMAPIARPSSRTVVLFAALLPPDALPPPRRLRLLLALLSGSEKRAMNACMCVGVCRRLAMDVCVCKMR